jgi:hypothetical protein
MSSFGGGVTLGDGGGLFYYGVMTDLNSPLEGWTASLDGVESFWSILQFKPISPFLQSINGETPYRNGVNFLVQL